MEAPMIAPKIVRPVPGDAPAAPTVHHQLGAPSQTHVYREYGDGLDPDEIGRVLRFDSANGRKEFRPLTLWKVGERLEWRWESWPSPRPLYGLDLLADRRDVPVLVVEGEKTADAAAKLFPDFVAITSPGGSGVAGKADWSPLKGRRVVIWPDSDEPGAKYAADVATRLHEIGAASVAIVTLPQGLPKGWDLADPLPKDFNPKSLRESLDNAAPVAAGNPPETTDQAAARLARLSRLEYDRVRKAEATSLGVRLESLDKEVSRLRGDGQGTAPGVGRPLSFAAPESWAHAVDGKALLDGIRATFTRYVALPDHADVALALWVMHTYVVDACRITPRLAILSPEKRCGKTTLLSILEALVCKPCPATLISAPALFRTVEAARPTFLIDEADTFVRDNGDLRNVVNSGYRRFGVTVKTAGEYHEPRQFSTFGPVALAAIGKLPDTIMDRSVAIPMRRRGVGESVESWREFKADSLAIFARQAARWADDNCAMLGNVNPIAPSALNDRAADNWYILFAIADRCGGDWPERAREAALALAANAED
ncbi:MAG: DUF3631 domain-containing protein, partial [Alphaproteobacteria bacterium]|nr:DUF3631 domain-containing protein [Alphaproteobacteria bacterium]